MAISYKFSPAKLNQWFDLKLTPEELLTLESFGVTCKASADGTKLEFGNALHGIVKNMPIKSGVMTMAKEGCLPIAAKASATKKINAALTICMKHLMNLPEPEAPVWKDVKGIAPIKSKVATPPDKAYTTEHLASALMDEPDIPKTKDDIVHGPTLSKYAALKMKKVKLENATALYQPVNATSQNSKYHCIGIAGKLKFGARWVSDSNLSIRVEGPVSKYKDKLVAAGFNSDYIDKGYTSVHFNGIEELIAKRALGAVLMGTGLEFETPMPDLGVITGEGT